MTRIIVAVSLSLGAALPALAHPGHVEALTQGEAHWLTQPDHLIVVALAALACGLALGVGLRLHRRRRARA